MAKKSKGKRGVVKKAGAAYASAHPITGAPYKGLKRAAMDSGANRQTATIAGIVGTAPPIAPVGATVGTAVQAYHGWHDGVLATTRHTNSVKTQKSKAKGTHGPVSATMNHLYKRRSSHQGKSTR